MITTALNYVELLEEWALKDAKDVVHKGHTGAYTANKRKRLIKLWHLAESDKKGCYDKYAQRLEEEIGDLSESKKSYMEIPEYDEEEKWL